MIVRRLLALMLAAVLLGHGAYPLPVAAEDPPDHCSTNFPALYRGETFTFRLSDMPWFHPEAAGGYGINWASTDDDELDAWQDGDTISVAATAAAQFGDWYELGIFSGYEDGGWLDVTAPPFDGTSVGGPGQQEQVCFLLVNHPIQAEDQHLSGPYSAFEGQLVASGGDGTLHFRQSSTSDHNVSVQLHEDGSITLYCLNTSCAPGSFTVDVTDGYTTETFTVSYTFTQGGPVTEVPPLPGGPSYGSVSPGDGGSDSRGGGGTSVDARGGDGASAPDGDDEDDNEDTGRGSETCDRCN
jgi:hypothetical protein